MSCRIPQGSKFASNRLKAKIITGMRVNPAIVIEFGKQNKDTAFLLHADDMTELQDEVKHMERDYYIVLPMLDDHADN